MYRKGVSALIQNKQGLFLLVNLISFEEKYFAIPGGGVEKDETLENAVYRELFEELGIGRQSLQLIGKSDSPLRTTFKTPKQSESNTYIGSDRFFFGFMFVGDESQILLSKDEIRVHKWVPFEQLGDFLLFENQLEDTMRKIDEIFGINDINK